MGKNASGLGLSSADLSVWMQNLHPGSKSAARTGSLERPQTNLSHFAFSASLNLSSSISQKNLMCWSDAKQFSYLVIFFRRVTFIRRSPQTSRSISSHVNIPSSAKGTTQAMPRLSASIWTSNSCLLNSDTASLNSWRFSQETRLGSLPTGTVTLLPRTSVASNMIAFLPSSDRPAFATSEHRLYAVLSMSSTSKSVTLSRMMSFHTIGGRSRLREFLVRRASPMSFPRSSKRDTWIGSHASEAGTHLSLFSPVSESLFGHGTRSGNSRKLISCSSLQIRWNASR
mmetsp:Transcript_4922/g.11807  ORF Transcript_4922/g.11807 Transcript_4922/m.11807 type:complete len:285 (-) Transcript_4922:16232-17086(-)